MKEKIIVLFSGGCDSTLAADIALRTFEEVHLITYLHSFMFFHDKIEKNVKMLEERHPHSQIIRYSENINKKFKSYFFKNIAKGIMKFGTIYTSWICGACKLAMHMTTIKYCLDNKIKHVFCGANKGSEGIFPAQMTQNINSLKHLYADFGIDYRTPVFDVERSDEEIYKLGITDNPKLKDQTLFYSTQHTCPLGIFLHAHSRIYYKRIFGEEKYKKRVSELFTMKLEEITLKRKVAL